VAGVQAPVERALARALRRAVVDHAGSEQRRVHAPVLHVGLPGALAVHLDLGPAGGPVDPGLAVDVVAAMRARVLRSAEEAVDRRPRLWAPACRVGARTEDLDAGPDDLDYAGAPVAGAPAPPADAAPLVWLTRAGDPGVLQDVDVHWLAAAHAAYAEAEVELVFVVVGRRGWHDPRSGAGRTWVRLRRPER